MKIPRRYQARATCRKGGHAVNKLRRLSAWLLCCALLAAMPILIAEAEKGGANFKPFYLNSADTVYVTQNGYCYHAVSDCGTSKYTYQIAAAEAKRLGYRACSRCEPFATKAAFTDAVLPEDDVIVYMMVEDNHYHASATCEDFDPPEDGRVFPHVAITLEEAEYLEKDRCPVCKPPKY
jgi:hypothetical protein